MKTNVKTPEEPTNKVEEKEKTISGVTATNKESLKKEALLNVEKLKLYATYINKKLTLLTEPEQIKYLKEINLYNPERYSTKGGQHIVKFEIDTSDLDTLPEEAFENRLSEINTLMDDVEKYETQFKHEPDIIALDAKYKVKAMKKEGEIPSDPNLQKKEDKSEYKVEVQQTAQKEPVTTIISNENKKTLESTEFDVTVEKAKEETTTSENKTNVEIPVVKKRGRYDENRGSKRN